MMRARNRAKVCYTVRTATLGDNEHAAHRYCRSRSGATVFGQLFIGGLLIFDEATEIKEYNVFTNSHNASQAEPCYRSNQSN